MTYHDLSVGLQCDYIGLDADSKKYDLEWVHGDLRFKANRAVQWIMDEVDLNELARCRFPLADMMQLYRMMGYSLCGFLEIFEDKIRESRIP